LRASGTLNGSNYGASWSYDADGNMTSQTNIATGYVTYYTWDYRNRLVEVKQEDNQGHVLNDEKFTYDVNNNRIAVSLNGTPQLYTVYDGSNPYMDFNGSGQLTERYLYNPNALSQFDGQVNASGTVQWFLTDNINSIRQVVSANGTVLDAITYDPYGNILSQTNAANAPRSLYAGGAADSLTGNDQFGRRYYSPADGRWLSQDPDGYSAGDPNLYRYVFNVPTNKTDVTGLWTFGIGYGFGISLFQSYFTGSIGLNFGYSFENGFSMGVSISGGVGLGLGLGINIGPTVTFTNAKSVADLGGPSLVSGAWAGLGPSCGGSFIYGTHDSFLNWGNSLPTMQYWGISIDPGFIPGTGFGIGGGVYGGVTFTGVWQWI
jgi:RHS repeat-associated protein